MNNIILLLLVVSIIIMQALLYSHLIPWAKQRLGEARYAEVERWVKAAVLAAQQTCSAKTGAERKAIVQEILKTFLLEKDISISDQQLDVMIEAAVKTMKIAEAGGKV
jgi:LL-H family phage holin